MKTGKIVCSKDGQSTRTLSATNTLAASTTLTLQWGGAGETPMKLGAISTGFLQLNL